MKTQSSQCSEQATGDLPDSLTLTGHSVPGSVDIWPQSLKKK